MNGMLTRILIWVFNTGVARKVGLRFFMALQFSRPVNMTVAGNDMFARRFDRIVAMIAWKLGLIEKRETKLMESIIRPGMHVVDIGANIGYYSLLFSRWVGGLGQVYAFEPESENYVMLCYARDAAGRNNLNIENAAVGSDSRVTSIFVNPIHGGDHRLVNPFDGCMETRVRMVALDDVFSQSKIDFIKMDIQGSEALALNGMKKMLSTAKKIAIFTEFTPFLLKAAGCRPTDFLNEMIDLGFKFFIICGNNCLRQVKENEIMSICKIDKSTNLLCLKGHWQDTGTGGYRIQ